MKLYYMIPAILVLTGIYLGLGLNDMWNYTSQDFIFGNLIVTSGICFVYLTKKVFKKEWDI